MTKKPQIEDWEIAQIRAMLITGEYSKQEIVAYFTRPGRSINQARINEIENDHERYDGIAAASPEELKKHLEAWNKLRFPSAPIVKRGPTHPEVMTELFPPRKGKPARLSVSETSQVEGKESFNWGSRHKYCKTLAGMANNHGGYILFGVKDGSFEVSGVAENRMEGFDLKKASGFVSRTFNQALEIQKGSFEVGGKTVGALYVEPSKSKPVVCTVDGGDLFSGDIYYRYPGETRRIQAPELEYLLKSRDQSAEKSFLKMVNLVGEAGVLNSAVLNLETGLVEGGQGSFVVDEALLEKVKIIARGHFQEDEGAPALKLIGDVRPVKEGVITIEQTVVGSITERNLRDVFFDEEARVNYKAYIQAQTCLQPHWLPIFFLAEKAEMTLDGLVEVLSQSDTPYTNRIQKQIDRVKGGKVASGVPALAGLEQQIQHLKSKGNIEVDDEEEARVYLSAMRLLGPDDVSISRMLEVLKPLHDRFGNSGTLQANFRYAIADIDMKWFRPLVTGKDN